MVRSVHQTHPSYGGAISLLCSQLFSLWLCLLWWLLIAFYPIIIRAQLSSWSMALSISIYTISNTCSPSPEKKSRKWRKFIEMEEFRIPTMCSPLAPLMSSMFSWTLTIAVAMRRI